MRHDPTLGRAPATPVLVEAPEEETRLVRAVRRYERALTLYLVALGMIAVAAFPGRAIVGALIAWARL